MLTALVLFLGVCAIVWFTFKETGKSATDALVAAKKVETKVETTKVEAVVVKPADLNHVEQVNLVDTKPAVVQPKIVAKKVEKRVTEKVKKTAGRKKKS